MRGLRLVKKMWRDGAKGSIGHRVGFARGNTKEWKRGSKVLGRRGFMVSVIDLR